MKPNESIFSGIFILLLFTALQTSGQSFSRENKVSKVFPVNSETEIEVNNKYGNITVENWKSDSVKFEIKYKVVSNKESRLAKNFETIDFDFNANQYYIIVNTVFMNKGSFWSDVSDIAGNLFAPGTRTSIDYTIYIPENQSLKLTLKYGNIFFADYFGTLKIDLSNGNLKAHNLNGKTQMDVSFGNVNLNHLENGILKMNYGTLSIENCNYLNLTSQSNEIELATVKKLILNSKRDKIRIEDINSLTGETYFTGATFNNIISNINLSAKYGSLKIKNIETLTDSVNLTGSNTTININLNKNDNYRFNIISNDKADVSVSTEIKEITTKNIDEDGYMFSAKGSYGKGDIPVNLNLKIKSGLLSIKFND